MSSTAKTSYTSSLTTNLWILFWAATCQAYSISSAEDAACSPSCAPTNPPLHISLASLLPTGTTSSPSPTPHPYDPLPNLSNNAKLSFIICMAVFGLVFIGFAISDALIIRWRRENGEELVEEWYPDGVAVQGEERKEGKEELVEAGAGKLQEWRERDRGVREELGVKGKGTAVVVEGKVAEGKNEEKK